MTDDDFRLEMSVTVTKKKQSFSGLHLRLDDQTTWSVVLLLSPMKIISITRAKVNCYMINHGLWPSTEIPISRWDTYIFFLEFFPILIYW